MSDLRSTCDLRDSHGKPVEKRWSKEWKQYFHLCSKCLRIWDLTHDQHGNTKEAS